MLTPGLPHTAAPLDSHTLLHALPDSRTLLPTLPHTAALPDTAVRTTAHTATHCMMNSNAAHRIPHTAYRTHQSHTALTWLRIIHVNVYALTWDYVSLCESIWILINFISMYMNLQESYWFHIWFYLFSFQITWFIPSLYEFKQLLDLFENMLTTCCLVAHCRTASETAAHCRTDAAHCRTLPHCGRTAAHCHKQCHTATTTLTAAHGHVHCHTHSCTAAHIRVHCRTLPHTAAHCCTAGQPHTAARTTRQPPSAAASTATHCLAHCCTLPHCMT
jgi:hypothetical protein